MTHLNEELTTLKGEVNKMFSLVLNQLQKGKDSLLNLNKEVAREILLTERRINAYELKIDRDCENIIALFNPVAIDLRCVLATLKINANLERIGDNAESIGKYVLDAETTFDPALLDATRVVEMFEEAINIMGKVSEAFENEDTILARSIFKIDETLDHINIRANGVLANYIQKNPDKVSEALAILSIIRKLERVGDQSKNVAEEIIFYVEAKVLKHRSKALKNEG